MTVAKASKQSAVILSEARTSRSEVRTESKDPYSHLPLRDYVEAFSPCTEFPR
jgi:hypothetical protein